MAHSSRHGKVYRDSKAAIKRKRGIAGKITTPDPFPPKKADKRAVSPWGQFAPWGYWGGWSGREFRRPLEATKSSDIERRLDRLLKEVEELRREIKKK
jgi:hypothetical protein